MSERNLLTGTINPRRLDEVKNIIRETYLVPRRNQIKEERERAVMESAVAKAQEINKRNAADFRNGIVYGLIGAGVVLGFFSSSQGSETIASMLIGGGASGIIGAARGTEINSYLRSTYRRIKSFRSISS